MQPQAPNSGPPMPSNQQPSFNNNQGPAPDYSFLNEHPQKSRGLPVFGSSFVGKIFMILFAAFVIIVILIIIKNIVSPPSFNKNAYLVVVERQNEMLHILNSDVTASAKTQLSPGDQNFAATAGLSLTTAQSKTLTFLADSKDKVDPVKLATVFNSGIDQNLNSSISSNNFDSVFRSTMQQQLTSYQQEIKTAYTGTKSVNGKLLLTAEYKEAGQLLAALNSSSS